MLINRANTVTRVASGGVSNRGAGSCARSIASMALSIPLPRSSQIPTRRMMAAMASFRVRGGASINRSGATSDLPGFELSIRSAKISTIGPAPVTARSWWTSMFATSSRTARTCRSLTSGNHSTKSATVAPAARFWCRAYSGIRVPAKAHAPLILRGLRSTAGHVVQSVVRSPPLQCCVRPCVNAIRLGLYRFDPSKRLYSCRSILPPPRGHQACRWRHRRSGGCEIRLPN